MADLACIPVSVEKIRAEVLLGEQVIAKTPFVKSFSVNKSRNQLSNTFNVTIQVLAGTSFSPGEMLTIRAGLKDNLKKIVTGTIKTTQVQPAFGLPSYYLLTLTGEGVLSKLENKRFTRRLKPDGEGLYCLITSGPTNRPDAVKSLDKPAQVGNRQAISSSPNPAKKGSNSPFTLAPESSSSSSSTGRPADMADKPSTGGSPAEGTTDSSTKVHDHTDLEQGGPAFGVFSSD